MYDLNYERNCENCEYLFLPNLRWATDTPDYILPMHDHLTKRLGKVGMILHGWDDTEESKFNLLKEKWEELDKPVLIIGNARLYLKAKENFPKDKVWSYWYALADYGLPPAPHTHTNHFKPSVVFDPWYFKDDKYTKMYCRDIMMMSNYEEAEDIHLQYRECTDEKTYKETFAAEAGDLKKPIITYCNNCRDYLAGLGIPVIHMLDLIFSHTDEKTQNHPVFTAEEKSENIAKLQKLLAEADK